MEGVVAALFLHEETQIMSLRGRYVIDRLKRSVSRFLKLPVPPYHNPGYWDGVYRSLGPDDVYEWGHLSLTNVLNYQYKLLLPVASEKRWETAASKQPTTTTLGETIGVYPTEKHSETNSPENGVGTTDAAAKSQEIKKKTYYSDYGEPILVLGCGNSRLGEDLLGEGWKGPIVQVDVSSRAVEALSVRCNSLVKTGDMQIVQDDASVLSAFDDSTIAACIDKGLIDALFCAGDSRNNNTSCSDVLKSVHRVLKPGGIFSFFSFSRPECLLNDGLLLDEFDTRRFWKDVQVRELDSILLYRFQKNKSVSSVRHHQQQRGRERQRHRSR